jgi:hypothetical protein
MIENRHLYLGRQCTNITLIVNYCTYTYTLCINTLLEFNTTTNHGRNDNN